MPPKHPTSTSRALYNIFVAPSLSRPTPPIQPRLQTHTPSRTFTCTHQPHAKTRAPELRTEKWDEEITAAQLYLVDPATNKLSARPHTRFDVLSRLDRSTHRLVQVGEAPGVADAFGAAPTLPVCKVLSKKEQYAEGMRKKAEAKEKKRVSAVTSSVKTLELNWAIDGNDLAHRLERMRGFLAEGRKVEVVLAAKKRGRRASVGECEGVVRRIREAVESVPGAREVKDMQGRMGGLSTLAFVGRAPKAEVDGEGS